MRRTRPAEELSPAEKAALAAAAERARRVEVGFLEGIRDRLPEHTGVMETLGCLYTEMGRYHDGLRADREVVRMQPDSPLAWYNLACSLSLTGQSDEAFAALDKAISIGYADADWMQEDEDLGPIRNDPRFARLVARAQARKS